MKTRSVWMLAAISAVSALIVVSAQGDRQPTCRIAPAPTFQRRSSTRTAQKAIAEKLTDQQVRDIDIGKAHVGIGVVYRGRLTSPAPESVAEHDLVSEVYHIIEGSATLVHEPRHRRHEAASGDARNGAPVQRTGQQRIVGP